MYPQINPFPKSIARGDKATNKRPQKISSSLLHSIAQDAPSIYKESKNQQSRFKDMSPAAPARRNRSLFERLWQLTEDPYVGALAEQAVECGGCGEIKKMDPRKAAKYYDGFWVKHKKKCDKIPNESGSRVMLRRMVSLYSFALLAG
jgi:hypothetical protein